MFSPGKKCKKKTEREPTCPYSPAKKAAETEVRRWGDG